MCVDFLSPMVKEKLLEFMKSSDNPGPSTAPAEQFVQAHLLLAEALWQIGDKSAETLRHYEDERVWFPAELLLVAHQLSKRRSLLGLSKL